MAPLPIDAVLPELLAAVRDRGAAVLVAPPGAGKTTRVPGALLDAGLAGAGDIVVLEPRRLATRLAATRVAQERGGTVGGEVGYEVRFDRKVSGATRIRFVTEGVLTRRLLSDPTLAGTSAVILDELHERHLAGDLALALLQRLRATTRPELRLIAMSATLDPGPVAAFLDAPVVVSEGRTFPIAIEHLERPDDRPLGRQLAAAVRRLCQDGLAGDLLAFLPGAGEIRRAQDELAEVAATFDLALLPLYGELPTEEQDRAIAPATRRKVILATNVAETSVTIDGVVAVIDAGLARVARHSPWSGMPSLVIEPIAQASAIQRAGRAGRTRPGRALRLYTKHDYDTRRPRDLPEIARADLTEAALELHAAGFARLTEVPWFEAPPAAAMAAADELLARLGAIDGAGAVTALGRRLLRYPAHPRQARLLVEAEARGVAREGAIVAALLGARELRLERRGPRGVARIAADSDLIEDLDAMLAARADRMRPAALRDLGLDVATAHAVDRAAQQLERLTGRGGARPSGAAAVDEALRFAILAGYPDRVARRRGTSADVVFAAGGAATLAPSSVLATAAGAEYLVAVDASDTGRGVSVRRASAIEPLWLLDVDPDRVVDSDELVWNRAAERVERAQRTRYGAIALDERVDPAGARGDPRAGAIVAREAVAAGITRFVDADALAAWRARLTFAAAHVPGVAAPNDAALVAALGQACAGMSSFAELRKVALLTLLDADLAPLRSAIDRVAPTHAILPRRRRVPIHYELDRAPWIASRLQDFFGAPRGPVIADGKVAVVLHLLAPNQRPVQVTQDLPGFWQRHYPDLRRQLMRRYPKHAWPEDPMVFLED
ncbi:MAG: ATP-dependent helicase HrpB [Kofleriaceae bacterium]|nr:ATP-dependent helicase HrpB [Kofleriaceae bacterium]MBP9168805.1 ATP-dependent helicase HrpB [Kofleriaceae bacterium]MBP9863370.1 ATP-dependent helicase HrpB [Kofleriaceae bacterium]